MATYENKLVVAQDGKLVKIGAADDVVIGGDFTAASVSGDGSGLTNLAAGELVGALPAIDGSALTALSSSALSGALPALDGNSLTNLNAANLSGTYAALNGSAITDLDAGNLASGTVPDARFPAVLPAVSGASLTNLDAGALASGTVPDARFPATLPAVSGSQLTNLDAGALASGTIPDARFPATLPAVNGSLLTNLSSSALVGALPALDGSALTDLNASELTSGTVPDTAFPASLPAISGANLTVLSSASLTGALPAIDGSALTALSSSALSGALPALDGSALTNLDASNISSGTLADARLSANVPLLDASLNTFTGNVAIGGALSVTGTITSGGQIDVIFHDSFIDMNGGKVDSSPSAGGLAINIKKATGFTAETATAFVAGVASTSNPYMTISSSTLAAGDIVQVHDTIGGANDGLYVVESVSGSSVYIKGIGTVAVPAYVPFAQNQFVASSGESASVVKIDLAVFAVSAGNLSDGAGSIAQGTFCYAYAASATESGFNGTWTAISSFVTPTLQAVYDAGDSIVLTNGNDLSVSKPVSGNAAISLEANAASKFEVVGADLDLKTSSSGDVVLTAAGVIGLESKVMLSDSVGFVQSVAAGVTAGSICYIDGSGVCQDMSSAIDTKKQVVVALETNSGGTAADKKVASVHGAKVLVDATSALSIGDEVYVSSDAGRVQNTAPASGRVIYVGECIGGVSGGLYPILFAPQYLYDA